MTVKLIKVEEGEDMRNQARYHIQMIMGTRHVMIRDERLMQRMKLDVSPDTNRRGQLCADFRWDRRGASAEWRNRRGRDGGVHYVPCRFDPDRGNTRRTGMTNICSPLPRGVVPAICRSMMGRVLHRVSGLFECHRLRRLGSVRVPWHGQKILSSGFFGSEIAANR
jgi:hypothetical protein